MDVVILARIQFAMTIAFHYLFPPLSIGLSLMLVIMEGLYLKTKNPLYKRMTQFWMRIFAISFALGVATGIVMSFSFGTNWARYSRFVGDVFGSALAAEGVFAFFLEAGFIGLMLFGWNRVKPGVHYFSTIMVSLGAHFSAVWIVIANSWMQTPAGFKIVGEGLDAKAIITDFWAMVFNPSSMERLFHVIMGCWLTGSFIIVSVAAYYIIKRRHLDFSRATMKIGLITGMAGLLLQLYSGDQTARGVAKNQPEKLATLEGVFKTEEYTPFNLIGWVDMTKKKVYGISVPGGLSFLVYHKFKPAVPGLDNFPEKDWPNVPVVFQTYHIMIMMWGAMFLLAMLGIIYWRRGTLWNSKWTLRAMVLSIGAPYIANQAGWFTAEMGRQPWIVYHLLRTAEGVSKSVASNQILGSILMFIVIYSFLFALFIYLMDHKIKKGPDEEGADEKLYSDPILEGGN
ncbi:MAG: cytochrome ubiquinol oxidase subunit I [Candidatus Algichlamydia australiensis]|nr:cytochrome ubiquinol oxidase subunit I [Chlamydiales bacterium]